MWQVRETWRISQLWANPFGLRCDGPWQWVRYSQPWPIAQVRWPGALGPLRSQLCPWEGQMWPQNHQKSPFSFLDLTSNTPIGKSWNFPLKWILNLPLHVLWPLCWSRSQPSWRSQKGPPKLNRDMTGPVTAGIPSSTPSNGAFPNFLPSRHVWNGHSRVPCGDTPDGLSQGHGLGPQRGQGLLTAWGLGQSLLVPLLLHSPGS